jgi:hypothetical protein
MWLITAIGSVHGQQRKPPPHLRQSRTIYPVHRNSRCPAAGEAAADRSEFTFALEQKRTYTVGREKDADIRFESRYVRPKEGTLVVGDWDPTQVSAVSKSGHEPGGGQGEVTGRGG